MSAGGHILGNSVLLGQCLWTRPLRSPLRRPATRRVCKRAVQCQSRNSSGEMSFIENRMTDEGLPYEVFAAINEISNSLNAEIQVVSAPSKKLRWILTLLITAERACNIISGFSFISVIDR